MSRGLGRMQRDIINALDEPQSWITYKRLEFIPAPEVFECRALLRRMAEMYNAYSHCHFVRPAFQVAFSRALHGLIARDVLRRVNIVPVIAIGRHSQRDGFEELSDGTYVVTNCRQQRFVRMNHGARCDT